MDNNENNNVEMNKTELNVVTETNNKKHDNNMLLIIILVVILLGGSSLSAYVLIVKPFKTTKNNTTTIKTTTENNTTTVITTTTNPVVAVETIGGNSDIGKVGYVEEEGYKVFQVGYPDTPDCLSHLYLSNKNELFGYIGPDQDECTINKTTVKINGKDMYKIDTNVKDIYRASYGQTGADAIVYTKNDNTAYYLNNDSMEEYAHMKPLEIKKIIGVNDKKLKALYSIGGDDSTEYVIVNEDNQAISVLNNTIYYDGKRNINTTLVGNDIYELKYTNTKESNDETTYAIYEHYFDVIKNGKKIKNIKYETSEISKVDEGSVIVFSCSNNKKVQHIDVCINKA